MNRIKKHIIGRYIGHRRGPLLICFGGMHGNEPAGVKAIELMIKMLEVEPITNPDFIFNGRFLGILSNLEAYKHRVRYIDHDLNRSWENERIDKISNNGVFTLTSEEQEMREILHIIDAEIDKYQPDEIVFLDLHTTSSFGGIFSIVADDEPSTILAMDLPAPVVKGMINDLKGTVLHFFNSSRYGLPVRTISFEAGHHDELLSVNRCIAAITCCMRAIHCVNPSDVESQHLKVLMDHAAGLPKLTEVLYHHSITNSDHFTMLPNFRNFQSVKQGQLLARDKRGEIHAKYNGRVLLPLYQKQGEDGFFIIEDIINENQGNFL